MSDSLILFDRGQGAQYLRGADEAGRDCMAGPLVAAAVRFEFVEKEILDRLDCLEEVRLLELGWQAKVALPINN